METINWDSVLQFPDSQDKDTGFMNSVAAPVIQLPTPPIDFHRDIDNEPCENLDFFSISTTFSAYAKWHTLPLDLVFVTSDLVLFYVHSNIILSASDNRFHSLIPTPSIGQSFNSLIHVPEISQTFNIILHLIYDIPSSQFCPSFETVSQAVDRLSFYGISEKACITAKTPLHGLILAFAPFLPMEVYTLAAKHDLLDLATSASSHLLAFDLSTLTDEMTVAMGPIYLRKLFFLHVGRCEALKKLLVKPIHPHGPTNDCSFEDQKCLGRAWALASAHLAWFVRPDLSIGFLESCLNPLCDRLVCDKCKDGLKARIKNLVASWSQVKSTI